MDPRLNPYAPGAGAPPPELAGRDELIERAAVALDRVRAGRAARSFVLYGLRGVGKTVLLNRIRLDAEARGIASVRMEAPEERSLPALLIPALRASLLRLSRGEALRGHLQRGMRALASFASTLKVKYQDIEFSIEAEPEAGLADSSDLDIDLTDLFGVLGKAAAERGTALVLYIDELQYVPRANWLRSSPPCTARARKICQSRWWLPAFHNWSGEPVTQRPTRNACLNSRE